jgi:hypothetical protein
MNVSGSNEEMILTNINKDAVERMCARLRALHIMDEVGSDNPLGRDAAAMLEALTTERTDDAVVELINQLRSIAPRRADGRAPPIAALNMDELCLWELNELMNKAADALAAMPTEQTNKVDEAVEVLKPFADGNLDVSESAVILGYPKARAALDRARAFLAKLGSTP